MAGMSSASRQRGRAAARRAGVAAGRSASRVIRVGARAGREAALHRRFLLYDPFGGVARMDAGDTERAPMPDLTAPLKVFLLGGFEVVRDDTPIPRGSWRR